MFPAARIVLALVGAALFLVGVALIAIGGAALGGGIWAVIVGGVVLIAVVLERQRYRSEAAEKSDGPAGPGGGEPGPPSAPFQPTEERFVDPTSNRVMRVYVDPRTGERRYAAER